MYARRLGPFGIPLGNEFLVNTTTTGNQWHPNLAMDHSGNFVVAWNDGTTMATAQSFDAAGNRVGSEFPLASSPMYPAHPDLAMDYVGNMAAVWDDVGGTGRDVYARLFGTPDSRNSGAGQVFHDQNANGDKDPGEPGMPGWTVYHDVNNNGVFDSGSYSAQHVSSTVVPTGTSRLFLGPGPGPAAGQIITDVNVTLNLLHPEDGLLVAWVISPGGRRVALFNGVGGSGDNFLGTTFDDSATISISQGVAPFSGVYQPVESLSAFNGEALTTKGYWMLEILHVGGGNTETGLLIGWSVRVNHTENPVVTDQHAAGAKAKRLGSELPRHRPPDGHVRRRRADRHRFGLR